MRPLDLLELSTLQLEAAQAFREILDEWLMTYLPQPPQQTGIDDGEEQEDLHSQ